MSRKLFRLPFPSLISLMALSSEDNSTALDKVKLINAGFEAFSAIATVCEPERGLDYRIVAITLYNGEGCPSVLLHSSDTRFRTP